MTTSHQTLTLYNTYMYILYLNPTNKLIHVFIQSYPYIQKC